MATGSEATERTPINPSPRSTGDEPNEEQIPPAGSVYNAILFLPALEEHKQGTLKTWQVMLMIIIFTTCVALQGGLTFLTGKDILESQDGWKDTLVFNEKPGRATDSVKDADATGASSGAEGGADGAAGETKGAGNTVEGGVPIKREDNSQHGCCIGSHCFAKGLTCCPALPRNGTGLTALAAQSKHEDTAFEFEHSLAFDNKQKKAMQRSEALCVKDGDGILSCAPPTMHYLEHFHELDFDGDGVWTKEEAREDAANFGCRFGVPAEDVFRRACRGLEKDAKDTAKITDQANPLPEVVASSKAIPHEWFYWWQGLATICTNTDAHMCGQLVAQGMFDEAMNPTHNMRRGAVHNLDSAMDYCDRLLTPGGICDSSLPVSYSLYRARVNEKCGAGLFSQGEQKVNPFDDNDVLGTVHLEYAVHAEYGSTRNNTFLFFLCLVLFLWYCALIDELKGICSFCDFVRNFPVEGGQQDQDVEKESPNVEESDNGTKIQRVSRAHWRICLCMVIVRGLMFVYLAFVGTIFLLSNKTFVDLLMNSVALTFIFELDEFIYSILVSEEEQSEHEGLAPLVFPSSFPHHGNKAKLYKKGNWGLTIIPALCVFIALWNDRKITEPIMEALDCVCFHHGPQCLESRIFDQSFWSQYWGSTAAVAAR